MISLVSVQNRMSFLSLEERVVPSDELELQKDPEGLEPLFIEPLDGDVLDRWLIDRRLPMTEMGKKAQIERICSEDMRLIHPSTALFRIQKIFSFISRKAQNPIYENMCNLNEILEHFPEKKLLNVRFGFWLNEELKCCVLLERCNLRAGLKILQDGYQFLLAPFGQIEQDLWRNTMTIIDPDGTHWLISQSAMGARNWKEIRKKSIDQDLGYGFREVAEDLNLPENTPESEVTEYVLCLLVRS